MAKKEKFGEDLTKPSSPYYLLLKDKLGVYLIKLYTPLRISKRFYVTKLVDCLDDWGYADSLLPSDVSLVNK